jgi:glutathione peroxidase
MGQAPGTVEEINEFCSLNYSTTFPRFAKIDVNGNGASPLYAWLREQAPEDEENTESLEFEEVIKPLKPLEKQADIKWNFGKFLIDREGNIAHRFSPGYTPEHVAPFIEELL